MVSTVRATLGIPATAAPEGLASSVRDLMRTILRRVQPVLDGERISMGQFWGLHTVSRLGPTSVRSVADHLLVSAPTACANLDALERTGLVERRRSSADRRVVEVVLTPKGREAEARVWRAIARTMGEGTRDIPRDDLEVAVRVFRTLVDRLEATDRVPPSRRRAA